jgi:hypothetical protein
MTDANLYYWFGVGGEGTFEIHHLISDFAPARSGILQPLPPASYSAFRPGFASTQTPLPR